MIEVLDRTIPGASDPRIGSRVIRCHGYGSRPSSPLLRSCSTPGRIVTLVIEGKRDEPPLHVVPHEDDDLVRGDRPLVLVLQRGLVPGVHLFLESLVIVEIDP